MAVQLELLGRGEGRWVWLMWEAGWVGVRVGKIEIRWFRNRALNFACGGGGFVCDDVGKDVTMMLSKEFQQEAKWQLPINLCIKCYRAAIPLPYRIFIIFI